MSKIRQRSWGRMASPQESACYFARAPTVLKYAISSLPEVNFLRKYSVITYTGLDPVSWKRDVASQLLDESICIWRRLTKALKRFHQDNICMDVLKRLQTHEHGWVFASPTKIGEIAEKPMELGVRCRSLRH